MVKSQISTTPSGITRFCGDDSPALNCPGAVWSPCGEYIAPSGVEQLTKVSTLLSNVTFNGRMMMIIGPLLVSENGTCTVSPGAPLAVPMAICGPRVIGVVGVLVAVGVGGCG